MKRGELAGILNVEDMRERAKALPRSLFEYIDGGAADELTVRENRAAFDRIWLRPRALADVSAMDLATSVFDKRISMPVMLAPCGFAYRFHSDGELAAALAAGKAGTVFVVPNVSTYPIELLAESAPGSLWTQMYLPPEREATQAILDRTKQAGIDVLCVTIDAPITGKRERNYRNRLTSPESVELYTHRRSLWRDAIQRPRWAFDQFRGRRVRKRLYTAERPRHPDFVHAGAVTAADIEWLRARWSGRLVIKGVLRGDECRQLIDLGVDGVIVSNHGGRDLDTARSTMDALPEVVDAIGGRAEVYLDGGVRRGTDIVKALALGARAVLVGRPYIFGLAVAGEAGVARVLEIYRSELGQTMALVGCPSIRDIDRSIVSTPQDLRSSSAPQ